MPTRKAKKGMKSMRTTQASGLKKGKALQSVKPLSKTELPTGSISLDFGKIEHE